jgi:hypothetical protein
MDQIIRFELFQGISWALTASLFMYMAWSVIVAFISWIKPKSPTPRPVRR